MSVFFEQGSKLGPVNITIGEKITGKKRKRIILARKKKEIVSKTMTMSSQNVR